MDYRWFVLELYFNLHIHEHSPKVQQNSDIRININKKKKIAIKLMKLSQTPHKCRHYIHLPKFDQISCTFISFYMLHNIYNTYIHY